MDKEELKKYIESNYNIKVQAVEKVKNSYRIGTENGDYAIMTFHTFILFYLQWSIYKKKNLVKFQLY